MQYQAVDVLAAIVGRVPPGVIFMAPTPVNIQNLRDRQTEVLSASQLLLTAADAAGRDLTDDEIEQINSNTAEAEKLGRQIAAREAVTMAGPGTGRRTTSDTTALPTVPQAGAPAQGSRPTVAAAPRVNDPKMGFTSFGDFAMTVRKNLDDSRIKAAATTYGNEGTGTDGGIAVPPTFRTEIWEKVMGEENLLTRCSPLVTGGNSITIPKDETTPWQTSGGVLAYWESEAAVVTASKPQLSMSQIRLAKLMALVPVTDELLEDAPGLESWLRAKAPGKMAAKINTAIVGGTGVGQPVGFLTAPATISVTKETSQAADTILFANIQKMWARMYAPCRRNAIWLINQDVEPQLNGMAFDPLATSKVPVYLPANGLSDSPYATLMGRPVVPIEACSTIGDQGDINLVDLSQYWVLTKGTDVQTDVSMHLYFDQGLQAYRFTFRVNGQPAWGKSIDPQHGTLTRSCFVTLDPR